MKNKLILSFTLSFFSIFALAQDEPRFDIESELEEKTFWSVIPEKSEGRMSEIDYTMSMEKIRVSEEGHPIYERNGYRDGTRIGRPMELEFQPYAKVNEKTSEGEDANVFFDYSIRSATNNSANIIQLVRMEDEEKVIFEVSNGNVLHFEKSYDEPQKPSCEERGMSEMECLKFTDPEAYFKKMREQHRQ